MSTIIDCMENLIAGYSMEFNLQKMSPFAIHLLPFACIREKEKGEGREGRREKGEKGEKVMDVGSLA